ncbi:MAG: type IV pili twitching motility protein PilT [Deltaproteobacteria bacterium HGW-Deltaproteobacteria-15]|jgi:twitching motility protein PilT|nr:MAG: type IV pili twitching motility protein PilT [Deltaproteobacteria bacterium HGW-Deltaproteobacteria-15]
MAKLDQVLTRAAEIGASDVHISVNNPPLFRHLGELKKFKAPPLTAPQTKGLLHEILTQEMKERFEKDLQIDFSYEIGGVARFRANVFNQRLGIDASFRIIPFKIPGFEELGLPPVITRILDQHQGLILVTGATGHGKSTTLAAMVDYLNETKSHHILTAEDPIEFVHSVDKKGVVNQRQIGRDTLSFANALKGALREDPDVILIGELRDPETISLALTAAETGHLVVGTMSTASAHKTLDRIIDSFPPEQQNQVRTMLADSIKGIITQRLIKDREGKKRVLAVELMVGTVPIGTIIRDNKTFQLPSLIQTGKKLGMQLMDESLMQLFKDGLISPEAAYANALNKKPFETAVKGK